MPVLAMKKNRLRCFLRFHRLVGSIAALLALSLSCHAASSEAEFRVVTEQQYSYDPCTTLDIRLVEFVVRDRLKLSYSCESLPWIRGQLMIEHGERDAMVTIPTKERRAYSDASARPLVVMKMRLYIAKNSPKRDRFLAAKKLEDLIGETFASALGSGWTPKEVVPRNIAVVWTKDVEGSFRMVSGKRDVFTIQGDTYALPMLKAMKLEQKIESMPTTFGEEPIHLMVSKRSKHHDVLARFDSEITRLKADGTLAKKTEQFNQELSAAIAKATAR